MDATNEAAPPVARPPITTVSISPALRARMHGYQKWLPLAGRITVQDIVAAGVLLLERAHPDFDDLGDSFVMLIEQARRGQCGPLSGEADVKVPRVRGAVRRWRTKRAKRPTKKARKKGRR